MCLTTNARWWLPAAAVAAAAAAAAAAAVLSAPSKLLSRVVQGLGACFTQT